MRGIELNRDKVRAMSLRLAVAWTSTWLAGIALLGYVAVSLSDEARRASMDGELGYYATAVYAMGWFDARGRFRDRVLLGEEDIVESPHGIWVLEPGEDPQVHWQPSEPRIAVEHLFGPAAESIATEDFVAFDHGDLRAIAHPIYESSDDGEERARGAVVVVGDATAGLAAQRSFVRTVLLTGGLIGLVGIGVGLFLAIRSTRPVAELIEHRIRFLTAAAHELKTPLAVFQAVHDSVAAGDRDPADGWRDVENEVGRARDGVDALFLHARSDAGTLAPERTAFRLDLFVESLVDEAELILDLQPTVVRADVELVGVALRNLLHNAQRHAGPERVEVRVHDGAVEILHRGTSYPAEVLQPDAAARGFVSSATGSGFGLSVARLVAEMHGGALVLRNREGGGAASTLKLPVEELRESQGSPPRIGPHPT